MDMHDNSQAAPIVYLDQWVWIRLAKVAVGRPQETGDVDVLNAVRAASDAGVVFPLSCTHYIETIHISQRRQRNDLAAVMAPISWCQTLGDRRTLIRHQILVAMHETFGRPTFRPRPIEVIGLGVQWAFTRVPGRLPFDVPGADGESSEHRAWLRQATQWYQAQALVGPRDQDIARLRRDYGYRPEDAAAMAQSRLSWETEYAGLVLTDPVHRDELRVRVQARELLHEHLEKFHELLGEYRVSLNRELGLDGKPNPAARQKMIAFADRIPSMRVAVDVKMQLFCDKTRTWTMNDLYDIDALSLAVPYSSVVVADKAMAHRLVTSGVESRHPVRILSRLADLAAVLPPLVKQASLAGGGGPAMWDAIGPGTGFTMQRS